MRTIQIIALLFCTALLGCNNGDNGIKPVTKPLMEAVYASGFVVSSQEYEVYSQAEGFVTDKLVEDGEEVKKGEALYIISAEQQSARNSIARETFELAQKNYGTTSPVLLELKTAVESAATKMRYDSANYVRYQNLLKGNATSKAEFDRIKLLYESSQNEHQLQKSRYDRTRNQLYVELQNARNNLLISTDEAGRYVIKSEVDGRVFMMAKNKGEMIRRSELVAVVGKNDNFFLQLSVDELDVQKVRFGQEILVKIDAYPDKVYNGKVRKVYPMVDRKLQSVRVDADLKDNLPGLFSGLALEANIIINKKSNAIVIPKSSLLPGDSVKVETDNGEKKVKVVTGIQTLDEVEIVDGIDTNTFIVMNPNK